MLVVGVAVFYLKSPEVFKYEINLKKGSSALQFTFIPSVESAQQKQENITEKLRKEFDQEVKKENHKIKELIENAKKQPVETESNITDIIHAENNLSDICLHIGKIKSDIEKKQDCNFPARVFKEKISEEMERRKPVALKHMPPEKSRHAEKETLPSVNSRASDLMLKGVQTSAKAVGEINPKYPRLSRINNEQGNVLLEAVIDNKGRCTNVKLIKSSGFKRLDEAAIKEVYKAKFMPARIGGQEKSSSIELLIKFKLT